MTIRTEHPFFVDARLDAIPPGRVPCASCGVATQPDGSEPTGYFFRPADGGHPKLRGRELPAVTAVFGACPACAARDTAWTTAFGPGWATVGLACRLLNFEGPPPSHALVDAALGGWSRDLPTDPAIRRLSYSSWVAAPESEHIEPWSQRPTILSRHQSVIDHPQSQRREEPEPEDPRLIELRRRAGLVSNIPFGHLTGASMADLRALADRRRDLRAHAGELVESRCQDAIPPGPMNIAAGCGCCGRSAYLVPYGSDLTAPWRTERTPLGVIGRGSYLIALCQDCTFEEDGQPLPLGDLLVEQCLGDRVEGWHAPGALVRRTFAARVAQARLFGSSEPAGDVVPWAHLPTGQVVGRDMPGVLQRDHAAERAQQAAADAAQAERLGLTDALRRAAHAERIAVAAVNVLADPNAVKAYQQRQAGR